MAARCLTLGAEGQWYTYIILELPTIHCFHQSNLTEQGSRCPAVQLFMTDELEEIKQSIEGKGTVIPQEWVYLQAFISSFL